MTFRSREILNADNIVGNFGFNNNMTSNCAGTVSGCTLNSSTGFDVASFLLGYATTKTRNLFDAGTYTEKRPEYALYLQDDWRVSSRLTLNLGLRYDIYVPWVEIEDRQSNFDESTGTFVVASDNATIQGVDVGRYLQTYSKGDIAPRFGFAYDVRGTGRTIVRGGLGMFWNFTPGGTSSSKAQNPPFLQSTALTAAPNTNFSNDPKMLVSAGLPAPPGVDPSRPPSGTTRSIFDINFRDAYTLNWNLNVQQQIGKNYMLEIAYAGARGRQYLLKGNPNEAPATVGVTNSNVLRPYATISPALRDVGQVQSEGILNYHGLLTKFQRRFANGISLLASYTFAKAMDYNSDNDGLVTVAERLRHRRLQLRAGQLRHHAHAQPERHVRAAVGARASGTAAGSSAGSTTTARACRWTSGSRRGCSRRAPATGRTRSAIRRSAIPRSTSGSTRPPSR